MGAVNPLSRPAPDRVIAPCRTYSAFVNDDWRLNDRLSFTLGLRLDANNTQDQGGRKVATRAQALPILFDWFFANGGIGRPTRVTPSIPGVNTAIDAGIVAASSDEALVGVAGRIGARGSWRADYLHRAYHDLYTDRRDLTTGCVTARATAFDYPEYQELRWSAPGSRVCTGRRGRTSAG